MTTTGDGAAPVDAGADEEFGGDLRPVPDGPGAVPHAVVWRLLRERARREEEDRGTLRAERDRRSALAEEVALGVHELRRFVALHTTAMVAAGVDAGVPEVLADRLAAALERADVQVGDPIGRPFAEVREWADPLPGGPAASVERLVVHATVSPSVWLGGRLLRRAQVELDLLQDDGPSETDGQGGNRT